MKQIDDSEDAFVAGTIDKSAVVTKLERILQQLARHSHVAVLPSGTDTLHKLLDGNRPLDTLHVIADFDMTLTKHWVPARYDFHDTTPKTQQKNEVERNLSSHGVLERGQHVSKDFAIHTRQLYQHYYPYEISTTLDIEEKTALMIEWWTKAHEAMIQEGFTREMIEIQAKDAKMQFRQGVRELLDFLAARQVPLLIFSAGIGDVIEALLRVNALERPNQSVVANRMRFTDEDGANQPGSEAKLIGFHSPLVHSLNKGERAVQSHSSLSRQIHERRKVILLGDSPGDAQMAAGAEHEVVLKIGLFNFGDDARRREFEQAFDILILNDTSTQAVLDLLMLIE